MVLALILSVTFAIVFCVLFFDDRGTLKELKDEVKSLQGENLNLKQVNERLGSEGKGSRDLLPLDADLIAEAVKFNGYVPVKGEDSVSFMVQGERYFITTDRLPYTIVVKQYGIDQSKYDTGLMRLAADQTTHNRVLGKVVLSEDGDALTFYVGGVECQYGNFRDSLVEMVRIVDGLDNDFGTNYNRLLDERTGKEQAQEQPDPSTISLEDYVTNPNKTVS